MPATGLIAHIVGARPNFMKAGPVVLACQERAVRQTLIHTGQHYDEAMSAIFFDQLGLPEPDVDLGVGSGSHAQQTAALLGALETHFLKVEPSLVVVYGDVNSTLAAALVAKKLHIPVAHVEAGLRSFDWTMRSRTCSSSPVRKLSCTWATRALTAATFTSSATP